MMGKMLMSHAHNQAWALSHGPYLDTKSPLCVCVELSVWGGVGIAAVAEMALSRTLIGTS